MELSNQRCGVTPPTHTPILNLRPYEALNDHHEHLVSHGDYGGCEGACGSILVVFPHGMAVMHHKLPVPRWYTPGKPLSNQGFHPPLRMFMAWCSSMMLLPLFAALRTLSKAQCWTTEKCL